MRIACVGGGPAASFLALLLGRDGGHHVEVFERSREGATYGFGVVFSRLSLIRLRREAPDLVDALLAHGASWDSVEVRRAGRTARSSGHGFAAVERRLLLDTLHRLARESGARLHFGTDVEADSLTSDYDLVIAADGASSRTRTAHPERFGAEVLPGGSRYLWFGVDRAFDAMTFLFARDGEHRVSAHVYPYSDQRSTFLVEMPQEDWAKAGFTDGHQQPPDWTDERARSYCQDLFGDSLQGGQLLSNGSRWLRFSQVHCARWSSGRLVLAGDAAHTAHFSVGSGTTMALEDAAALAAQLTAAPHDLTGAVARYEAARRPAVTSIQRAAWASRQMWERPRDHDSADAGTLLLRLLSRSAQSSSRLLLRLDPGLPDAVGHPVTPHPAAPVPVLAPVPAADDTLPAPPPAGAIPLIGAHTWRSGTPGAPSRVDDGEAPLLLVLPPDAPGTDLEPLTAYLGELRRAHPDRRIGVLMPAPAATDQFVRRAAALLLAACRTTTVDLVAIAPPDSTEDRPAQMVLCEQVRPNLTVPLFFVCAPGAEEDGWTHVQASRADGLWSLPTAVPRPATARNASLEGVSR